MEHTFLKLFTGLNNCPDGEEEEAVRRDLKETYQSEKILEFYRDLQITPEQNMADVIITIANQVFSGLMVPYRCVDLADAMLRYWDLRSQMYPNLIVITAILIRERIPSPEQTLSELVRNTMDAPQQHKWQYNEFSRAMSIIPPSMFELFSVEKKSSGRNTFNIKTHYPELFGSILYAQGHAPFASHLTTACSYLSNQRFFEHCLPHSFVSGEPHSLKELEHFYLLERLFRLDLKQYIFQEYFLQLRKQEPTWSLSIEAVADILFHSPLVFFEMPEFIRDDIFAYVLCQPDLTLDQRAVFVYLMLLFEIYLVPVCTKILYGKLACYDPQTVLKQLESAAAELNLLDHYWLLPRAENVPNRKERTVYSKQFGCFSEPGQFDLSRRATRTECTLVTSPIPEGPEQSKRVYQQALRWVDPFYEFYK